MITTNEAFIRAYGRSHESRGGQERLSRAASESPLEPTSVGCDWRTSVRVVGLETEATAMEAVASAAPSQPVLPSSIRYQQQYYRLDQPWPKPGLDHAQSGVDDVVPDGPPPTSQHVYRASGYSSGFMAMPPEPKVSSTAFHYPEICKLLSEQVGAAFESVADAIEVMANEGRTLIGVAAALPSAGCTTTLLTLAQRLLSRGRSVVIADANFSRPGVARSLGIPLATTWQDVLLHGAPLDAALVCSAHDNLTILPAAQDLRTAMPPAQLSMTAGAIRYRFDVALVDLGAVLTSQQAAISRLVAQSMRVDGVLVVADAERDDWHARREVEQFFADSRCAILGTVENFAADAS